MLIKKCSDRESASSYKWRIALYDREGFVIGVRACDSFRLALQYGRACLTRNMAVAHWRTKQPKPGQSLESFLKQWPREKSDLTCAAAIIYGSPADAPEQLRCHFFETTFGGRVDGKFIWESGHGLHVKPKPPAKRGKSRRRSRRSAETASRDRLRR